MSDDQGCLRPWAAQRTQQNQVQKTGRCLEEGTGTPTKPIVEAMVGKSKWGLGPKGANWANLKGPFRAFSALPRGCEVQRNWSQAAPKRPQSAPKRPDFLGRISRRFSLKNRGLVRMTERGVEFKVGSGSLHDGFGGFDGFGGSGEHPLQNTVPRDDRDGFDGFAVSAVVAVLVVTATPLKLNPPFPSS